MQPECDGLSVKARVTTADGPDASLTIVLTRTGAAGLWDASRGRTCALPHRPRPRHPGELGETDVGTSVDRRRQLDDVLLLEDRSLPLALVVGQANARSRRSSMALQ